MEEAKQILEMSAQELIDAGYNPFGAEIVKKVASGEISEEQLLELLDRANNKSRERKEMEFREHIKTKKELNRAERRLLEKRYSKSLRRGK